MNCSNCGKELEENAELCPFCGEEIVDERPVKNKNKKIALLLCALALCGAAGAAAWLSFGQSGVTSAEEAAGQRSYVSYNTKKAVHSLLPETHQELTIYRNGAKNMNSYTTFQQMLDSNSAYLGKENFARLGEEVLYLRTEFYSYDSMTQALDAKYSLCSLKNGKETVIDEGVEGISCSTDSAVYYLKSIDGLPVQYCYSKGQISDVSDQIAGDVSMITHCSKDGSVLGFVSATFDEQGAMTMSNGYLSNGVEQRFEGGSQEVYSISPDGKHIYLVDILDGNSRAVTVKYVSDQSSGATLTLAENVTECSFYGDSGAMTAIAVEELSEEIMNPVGKLLYFDPAASAPVTITEGAVALVESVEKSYPWLNEDSRELLVTEQSGLTAISQELLRGSFHFINEAGSLCAADQQGNVFEIEKDFYIPENYVYNSELLFLAEKNDGLYWAKGDKVYRYTAGSMTAPETVTLDSSIISKIETGVEIGYLLLPDGSVLEQSGNTLNHKPFGGASSCIYDSPADLSVVGLSENGSKVYFSSEGKLYEKMISSDAAPVLLAENVEKAIAVDNGLYLLTAYSEERGGTLQYRAFDGKELQTIRDGVWNLSDTVIQE